MISQHEQVTVALNLLADGLRPYLEQTLQRTFGDNWVQVARSSFRDHRNLGSTESGELTWDAHSLLTVMWDQWNAAFRQGLGHQERSLVSELREVRNRWAHQHPFDFDDAYRTYDSVLRLLSAVEAPNVEQVRRRKIELLESHVADRVNHQIRQADFDRSRWWVIGIYVLCCIAVTYHMMTSAHSATTALVSFVVLVFLYMAYQQFKLEVPLIAGPRECPGCRKIVYRAECPYCEAHASSDVTAAVG